MTKTLQYVLANVLALVILMVAYETEVVWWMFLIAAVVALAGVNLLVAWIGPAGDSQPVKE